VPNSHDIDVDALSLGTPMPGSPRRPPRRVHGRFLRGPVPWAWLASAGRLPGRALHVGLALWLRVGLTNALTVSISLSALAAELGFDRSTASRALATLARAGLVAVQHGAGRNCSVTVLAASAAT
jgi:DNA-binding MarR family transcriptional regulator